MDLVRDEVQYGLVNEVKNIEATMKALEDKIRQSK